MYEFFKRLKVEAEANPMLALGIGAGAITAIAKLIEAVGGVASKRAYAQDAKRRSKKG
jgi:hypothetical protein